MRQKLDIALLVLLTAVFAAITVLLFLPAVPVVLTFSFYLVVVLAIQIRGRTTFAFALTGFVTLVGMFAMIRGGEANPVLISSHLLTLWGGAFLLYLHRERSNKRGHQRKNRRDFISQESRVLEKEILFYDERKSDLSKRSQQRRVLVSSARALGACLDPADIQARLSEFAQVLFPNRRIVVSVGQNPDPIDSYILKKGQPLLIPTSSIKGDPLIAVPIKAQGSVVGILRVGGDSGAEFLPEDLRQLDILGSLSSLALENSYLFHQVQETALRDNLTGLWTHRAFQDQIEAALLEASRYGTELSLIMTDVDHFKMVNDTYGHQAGDQVLQGFSQVLMRHVRDIDIVARYGGEEFVLLLFQTSHGDAVQVADQIRRDLEAQRFEAGGAVIGITGSFGVSTFPLEATSAQQLIRLADERMYKAKHAGRNCVIGKAA